MVQCGSPAPITYGWESRVSYIEPWFLGSMATSMCMCALCRRVSMCVKRGVVVEMGILRDLWLD